MKFIGHIIILSLIFSCSGTKQFSEQDNQAYVDLKSLVASKKFKIESYKASAFASVAFNSK